jgi:xylulokinase
MISSIILNLGMPATVLGIDIGTGGSRALLLSESGDLLAAATAEHAPFVSQQSAWAEQDPQDWWRACRQAIRSVLAQSGVSPRQIACVGLSGQMHGTVVLDENGDVLRPAIIWCDQRGEEDCRWLNESVGKERLLELTANPALTNFTLIKLLWMRRSEPDTWRRVRRLLLPKD